MTAREARNSIIKGLHEYLGVEVYKSNQIVKERYPPYIIYSILSPYMPGSALGEYRIEKEGEKAMEIRKEQPSLSISFTVCSVDRIDGEKRIFGDDEAMDLAEQAEGWFLHTGYDYISQNGMTVTDVTNVQNREVLLVDEEANRYGFDVTVRYVKQDVRKIQTVESMTMEGGSYTK